MLPKTVNEILNGGIYQQRIRCGKANCHCASGERHLGYYFFTRINGKLRKKYIRKKELENFSKLTDQASLNRKRYRQTARATAELSKKLSSILRNKAAVVAALKGNLQRDQEKN